MNKEFKGTIPLAIRNAEGLTHTGYLNKAKACGEILHTNEKSIIDT